MFADMGHFGFVASRSPIPAFAGMTSGWRKLGELSIVKDSTKKAAQHFCWTALIPAFAGMTISWSRSLQQSVRLRLLQTTLQQLHGLRRGRLRGLS
jgi:hypothetical protein